MVTNLLLEQCAWIYTCYIKARDEREPSLKPLKFAGFGKQTTKHHGMKYIKIIFCLFVFCCANAGAQSLTFIRGTSYNVSISDTALGFGIPIELGKDVEPGSLHVTILDAKSDKLNDDVRLSMFSNASVIASPNDTVLNIDINNQPPVTPATYTLFLKVYNSAKATEEPKTYTITITVNAATLATLAPIVVERTNLFFGLPYSTNDKLISVREASKKSAITNISLHTFSVKNSENRLFQGIVTGENQSLIPPGGTGTIVFRTTGDFPLGRSTASVDIVAPEFADPVPVTIEITTKTGWLSLLFVIVLGLLSGWYVRNVLTDRINLNTARLPGIDLKRIIIDERNKRADKRFVDAANKILHALELELNKEKLPDIVQGIDVAKKLMADLITEYGVRLADVQNLWDRLKSLADALSKLPATFQTLTGDIPQVIADAQTKMGLGEIDTARTTITNSTKDFSTSFYTALEKYLADRVAVLEAIETSQFALPEITSALDDLLKSARINVTAQPPIDSKLFEVIGTIDYSMIQLLSQIARFVNNKTNKVLVAFSSSKIPIPDREALLALQTRSEAIVSKITSSNKSYDSVLVSLPVDLNNLFVTMKTAVYNQIKDITEIEDQRDKNEALKDAIEAGIKTGLYGDAAEKAIAYIKNNLPVDRDAGGDEGRPRTTSFVVNNAQLNQSVDNTLPREAAGFETMNTVLPDQRTQLELQYQQTQKIIERSSRFQNSVSAVLVIGFGFLTHAENFIGTPTDVAAVFGWAFLVDLSISTITSSLLPKLGK